MEVRKLVNINYANLLSRESLSALKIGIQNLCFFSLCLNTDKWQQWTYEDLIYFSSCYMNVLTFYEEILRFANLSNQVHLFWKSAFKFLFVFIWAWTPTTEISRKYTTKLIITVNDSSIYWLIDAIIIPDLMNVF